MDTSIQCLLALCALYPLSGCAADRPRGPAPREPSASRDVSVALAHPSPKVDRLAPTSPGEAPERPGADVADELAACPDHPGEPSNDSPSYLVDDLGDLYEACVADYLDVFGAPDQPIVDIGPLQRRRAVCAALGREGYAVFERAQSGKHFRTTAPENCVDKQKQEFRMGRIIWEFSKLPNGSYLATRTARAGSPWGLMYQGHRIDTSLDDPFVVTVVKSDAWRCPQDDSDPCDLYSDEQNPDVPGQVRCAGDQMTLCSQAGMTSAVYVTDYRTRATAYFGDFFRRPNPTIKIDAMQVVVSAGDCTQAAPLPLVAAEPP